MTGQADACGDESAPLARVTRSGVQDTLHRGAVVVVDDRGREILAIGSPKTPAYIRSSAKPIQCIPVITSGAVDAFRLDDRDIAIICGSHKGGPEQVAQVRSILAKCGLDEALLLSGTGITDNCSGKHAGMLAACLFLGLPLDTYTRPDHPHQLHILDAIRAVCCLEAGDVHIGTNGCSAPIHYFDIRRMALGYARMGVAERHFDAPVAAAVARIIKAMAAAPTGHTGEPPYAELFGGEARLITKAGGNGVYCAGVVGHGLGFAMKVEDGSGIPLRPVFIEVMRRLGVLSEKQAADARERFCPKVENRRGQEVGAVEILA